MKAASFLAGLTLMALAFSIPGDQIALAAVGGALIGAPLGIALADWFLRRTS